MVAVDDLELATTTLRSRFGFRQVAMAGDAQPGICTLAAGGVTLVLVGPQASPSVAEYLQRHGPGVQHVAVEVLNAGFARACLADAGTPLLTEVLVDGDGHEQFFAATSLRRVFSWGSSRAPVIESASGADNVLALFDAIRTDSP